MTRKTHWLSVVLKPVRVNLSLLSSRNAPSELDYSDFLSMK